MALLSLSNRSLKSKWLTCTYITGNRNQKKRNVCNVFLIGCQQNTNINQFLQTANNTQCNGRGERVIEDHQWRESICRFCRRQSALPGPSRLKKFLMYHILQLQSSLGYRLIVCDLPKLLSTFIASFESNAKDLKIQTAFLIYIYVSVQPQATWQTKCC